MEASLRRQQLLANHLQPSGDLSRSTTHTDGLDDICIIAATRTPITKAKKGGLKVSMRVCVCVYICRCGRKQNLSWESLE